MNILTLDKDEEQLRQKSEKVENVEEIKETISQMLDLVRERKGAGLSAPQIGIHKRFFVLSREEEPNVFINPELVSNDDGYIISHEGCLSIPDEFFHVLRHSGIVVVAQDIEGNEFTYETDGLASIVIQHELDHLEGILVIDRDDPPLKEELARIRESQEVEKRTTVSFRNKKKGKKKKMH